MQALGQNLPWTTFDCGGDGVDRQRWRLTGDGRIEIEGDGLVTRAWPEDVDQWADLVAKAAASNNVPAYWIAAVMALETRGKPGLCARTSDGGCSSREGVGLMAMLTSTASSLAGRSVSASELLDDYALQIDLGAKYIATLHDKYGGDFVPVAVGYNAGSVKCATSTSGNTWNIPREPCPPTPWGVIMGCMRTEKRVNDYCAPSAIESGKYVCPVDYPRVAIAMHNAALEHGWNGFGLGNGGLPPGNGGDVPGPLPGETPPALAAMGGMLSFAVAGVAGYYSASYLYARYGKRR